MRSTMASRNRTALAEVARVPTCKTSQRETTSRAVKCLSITPGGGRTSSVSTWPRPPGLVGRNGYARAHAHAYPYTPPTNPAS